MTKEREDVASERPATDRTGTIGIIGAGNIGQALARTALRADREVVISNSRGPESLAPVVAAFGEGVSAWLGKRPLNLAVRDPSKRIAGPGVAAGLAQSPIRCGPLILTSRAIGTRE
jgi:hypothetical protein